MSESQPRKSASWFIVTTVVRTEYLVIEYGIGLSKSDVSHTSDGKAVFV